MQLTPDQDKAAQAFVSFLLDPAQRHFILSGMAGTGKTTLLKYLLWGGYIEKVSALIGGANLLDRFRGIYFTATTNKAADVLMGSLPKGTEISTIHTLLKLRVQNDYSSGVSKLIRSGAAEVIEDSLIFVDEASMVNNDLLRMIDQGTLNCKIVFIGDHCQLAPVKETHLPVFAGLPQAAPQQDLVTQVRSIGAPGISALSLALRQGVAAGLLPEIHEVPGEIEYLDPAAAEQMIIQTFQHDPHPDARVLCYTNQQVLNFNRYLRNLRGRPADPQVGEYLVSNSMCYTYRPDGKRIGRLTPEHEVRVDEVDGIHTFTAGNISLDVYRIAIGDTHVYMPTNIEHYRRLLKQTAKAKDWHTHFQLKEEVADLRERDAQTVHKSQGSTYRDVFVHLSDIGSCTQNDQIRRMLYVACSRATHHVYLFGQLPPRAFTPAT